MFANGTEWQEQRRFLLRQLRDFGFGKIKMEPLIHEEIKKSIAMIKKELKDRLVFFIWTLIQLGVKFHENHIQVYVSNSATTIDCLSIFD